MIVRILGEGQLDLDDKHLDELNIIDAQVADAVAAGDEARFTLELGRLLDKVRSVGALLPEEMLSTSDLILPGPDSSLAEVASLLGDEGLIPG